MLTNTILHVPFSDKDQAKKLGAKWDPKQKAWYVPPGQDVSLFKAWLPTKSTKPKLIISSIGLVRVMTACWSCKGYCTVHAIYARELRVLPEKLKNNTVEVNTSDSKTGFFILTDINDQPEALAQFLILRCPNYRKGKVNTLGEKLYRNHCDHCSIGLSDNKLHKKGKAFHPQKLVQLQSMQFIDLLFFDSLEIQAEYIDYSENQLFMNSIEFADYLTDFI